MTPKMLVTAMKQNSEPRSGAKRRPSEIHGCPATPATRAKGAQGINVREYVADRV
jgi:hypothetical protein